MELFPIFSKNGQDDPQSVFRQCWAPDGPCNSVRVELVLVPHTRSRHPPRAGMRHVGKSPGHPQDEDTSTSRCPRYDEDGEEPLNAQQNGGLHTGGLLQRVRMPPNGRLGSQKWLPGGHFRQKSKKSQNIPNDPWAHLDPKTPRFRGVWASGCTEEF